MGSFVWVSLRQRRLIGAPAGTERIAHLAFDLGLRRQSRDRSITILNRPRPERCTIAHLTISIASCSPVLAAIIRRSCRLNRRSSAHYGHSRRMLGCSMKAQVDAASAASPWYHLCLACQRRLSEYSGLIDIDTRLERACPVSRLRARMSSPASRSLTPCVNVRRSTVHRSGQPHDVCAALGPNCFFDLRQRRASASDVLLFCHEVYLSGVLFPVLESSAVV